MKIAIWTVKVAENRLGDLLAASHDVGVTGLEKAQVGRARGIDELKRRVRTQVADLLELGPRGRQARVVIRDAPIELG